MYPAKGVPILHTQRSFVKTLTVIFGLFLVLSGVALADGDEAIPFSVGEKLTYQIFWGPFVVGRATLEVAAIESGGRSRLLSSRCEGEDQWID